MSVLKAKAILLGVLVAVDFTLLRGFLPFLLISSSSPASSRPMMPLGMIVFGIAANLLAGYVAGRVAKREEVMHAAVVGAIVLGFGVVLEFLTRWILPVSQTHSWPSGRRLLGSLFQFAEIVIGGWLANRWNERSNVRPDGSGTRLESIGLAVLLAVPVIAGVGHWAMLHSLQTKLSDARAKAHRTMLRSHVQQALRACRIYAARHDGHFPNDLRQLEEVYGADFALVTNRFDKVELVTTNATLTDASTTVLIRAKRADAEDYQVFGYADGRVETIETAAQAN